MHFNDHGPPHFHAVYGGRTALVSIVAPDVFRGSLPPRAQSMVLEWASLRQAELWEAWSRAQRTEDPGKIAPLE